MPTNNPWFTPYQRSYQTIKAKMIASLKQRIPEITDFSEGNIFIIITGIWAAIAEVIHYYIDNMAREAFLPTARRYSSVSKHAKLVDYHIKAAIPASVDITLYRITNEPIGADITIPVNTIFTSDDGKQWLSSKTILWPQGTYSIRVPVVQKEPISDSQAIQIGTITEEDVIIYIGDIPTGLKYVEGSMVLTINGSAWELVTTFAYSGPEDQVYKVEIDENLKPYIIFGNGRFGKKPDLNGVLLGTYYITYGAEGNIADHLFSTIPSAIASQQTDLAIVNYNSAAGGSDYEDFDMLKEHIPLSIKTLGVAITKEDFEAVTMLVPGVAKAYCNYICGKYVEIYITPDNGGTASEALLDETLKILQSSKVITTQVTVYSTFTARIYIDARITGRKSFSAIDISNQVKRALIGDYNYATSDINRVVRLSDIYALIDNQSMVDYLTIDQLSILSQPSPLTSGTQSQLIVSYFKQDSFNTTTADEFEVITITTLGSTYTVVTGTGKTYTGNYGTVLEVEADRSVFSLTIEQNDYQLSGQYQMVIQPMNRDLVPVNYNIPIFQDDTITLNITETI